MERTEVGRILVSAEQALASGASVDLRRLGFWRVVETVKDRRDWIELETALARRNSFALVPGPDEVLRRLARAGDLFAAVLDERSPRLSPSHATALAS